VGVDERELTTHRSWQTLGIVLWPWLLSRVVSVSVLLIALDDGERGSKFVQLATRWDGAFYLDIARYGYGTADVPFPKWPFFPLLPGLIHALSEVADDKAGIFALNQLVFFVALVGVHRIATRHGGATVARLAVWAIALFPVSFVFSMTYPSAIFLAASVWAFVFVEEHHDLAAGVVAVAAALVRPNGLVVALALIVAVRTWKRAVIVAGPAIVAVVLWCIYCYDRTNDALVFLTTKSSWHEITIVGMFSGDLKWSPLPHVLLAVGAIVVLVMQR
jgi:Gpi18-like mannosyltransferase